MASSDRTQVWARSPGKGSGPAPAHSLGSIGTAAVGLADAGGLSQVSMRKVAAALGTGAATLYRYVASHDELLEVMIDRVAGEYDLSSSTASAAEQILNLALQGRHIMHGHPWVAPLLLTRPSLGPNSLDYLERALEALADNDLPGPRKLQAIASLTAITSAFVQNELSAGAPGADTAGAGRLSAAVASGNYPHLARGLAGSTAHREPAEDVFRQLILRQLRADGITED